MTNTRAQSLFQLYVDVNSVRKCARAEIDGDADDGTTGDDAQPVDPPGGSERDESLYSCDPDAADGTALQVSQEAGLLRPRQAQALQSAPATTAQLTALGHRPDIVNVLVDSFCPSIYGVTIAKLGVLLSLFGGVPVEQSLYSSTTVRGNIHVLLLGDPGLGKSQLLRFASTISPRGVYVGGNVSTSSGLTVTLVRDKGGSSGRGTDFALEPGALVLADEGVACVDELDKMAQDHPSLLEAMEQQTVSVAKAGVVCTLNAKTSVLAAANPSTGKITLPCLHIRTAALRQPSQFGPPPLESNAGRYDVQKTILENVKMSTALLSRFDLVFLLRDRGNRELDSKVRPSLAVPGTSPLLLACAD